MPPQSNAAARPWAVWDARASQTGWAATLSRGAAAAGAGAVFSYAQAPTSLFFLLFLSVPVVWALARSAQSARGAAWVGWAFGVGYFLPGLAWIGRAFLVDADRFAWMLPFAITLLPMGLSLFWAAAFAGARALCGRLGGGAGAFLWALALFWSIAEFARGHVLTGFPWSLPASIWVGTPIDQALALVGPYGLTALTLFCGLAIGAGCGALKKGAVRMAALWCLGGAAPLALCLAFGLTRMPAGPAPQTDALMRVVQPNVPQHEKWAPELLDRNLRWLLDLSVKPGAPTPDVVVWPETAVVSWVVTAPENRAAVASIMPPGATLIVGAQRLEEAAGGRRYYNSLFTLQGADGDIAAQYDKHKLVPFGEFLPLQETLNSLGLHQLAGPVGGFSSGVGPQVLAPAGAPSFVPLICYEAIFPEAAFTKARPDYLAQITNDAWFGDSGGPRQHFAQAQMRAIEQGLPLVRSANTGISAVIDPYGRVVEALALNTRGAIDVKLPAKLSPTLYAQYGELGFYLIALIMAACLIVAGVQHIYAMALGRRFALSKHK